MSTQQQDQHSDTGATDIQQLNPVGPTRDRESSALDVLIICSLNCIVPFPFDVQGRMWNSNVSVLGRCLVIATGFSYWLRIFSVIHKDLP